MASPPSSPQDDSTPIQLDPPQAVPLALPAPIPQPQSNLTLLPNPTPPSSRRLPPPCWSHDETIALIDSYRDKWYTLRRGNLKATHWQEVANAVSQRCPAASPPKTAVQCRHKMEKLRKRYRTEISRARSMPLNRFTSSWVHFKRMDAMEKGPAAAKRDDEESPAEDDENEENDEEDGPDQQLYEDLRFGSSNMKSMSKLYRNGVGVGGGSGGSSGGGSGGAGFRIRIPTAVSIAQPGTKGYPKMMENQKFGLNSGGPNSGPGYVTSAKVMRESGHSVRSGVLGKREREGRERERERGDPVAEMVAAIKLLGDGFVRMEHMKMEMAREIETTRMEMEMKRTEMILDSQQRIVEAFAKAVSDKKNKAKRMPLSPEP